MPVTAGHGASRSRKWTIVLLAMLLSAGIAIVLAEGLLRWALFHTSIELAAKDPAYYARSQDELWIYRHLFSKHRKRAAVADPSDAAQGSGIAFYRDWATSLVPDAQLGYARRADVRTPCHETTHLSTRGTREYAAGGRRIVFFGDSFVESAACSNDTLTTKIESLTGIDTLNYGVGGYGLDQIFLSFERVAPGLNGDDSLVLVGLIQNDLDRVLLQVRAGPKPYFTISGDRLELHTGHIHPDALDDYFQRPPERFYLYDFLRGRLGYPVYASVMRQTRDERHDAVLTISRLLFERFAAIRQQDRFRMAFVIFPTPGAPFDPSILDLLRARGLPVVDLQSCLRDSGRPDTELYAELHPTSLGNALLAACLVRDLSAMSLLGR